MTWDSSLDRTSPGESLQQKSRFNAVATSLYMFVLIGDSAILSGNTYMNIAEDYLEGDN